MEMRKQLGYWKRYRQQQQFQLANDAKVSMVNGNENRNENGYTTINGTSIISDGTLKFDKIDVTKDEPNQDPNANNV